MRYRKFTDAHVARARSLYAEHRNYTTVGKLMGFSKSTVYDWLNGYRGPDAKSHAVLDDSGWRHVPPEVLADRDRRRELQPRDLTALLMGDPIR